MNINQAFPSKYLKASDIEDAPVTVKIKDVVIQDIGMPGKAEEKPVIQFYGDTKSMVCNKTNSKVISSLYGNDTDDWIGKSITLIAADVEFQGDTVRAIRVSKKVPQVPKGKAPATTDEEYADATAKENEEREML